MVEAGDVGEGEGEEEEEEADASIYSFVYRSSFSYSCYMHIL